jgi:hypothetical protein
MCKAHYLQAQRLIKNGKTSWHLLQESGQALPSRQFTHHNRLYNLERMGVDTTTKGSV